MIARQLSALFSLVTGITFASFASAQQIELDGFSVGPTIEERARPSLVAPGAETEEQEAGVDTIVLPLRPLRLESGDTQAFRVSGQHDQASFSLFLPRAMAGAELRLATQSAIDVLPQRSSIAVEVNGTPIGTITPDNFEAPRIESLPIPDDVLTSGRNLVTLTAQHVHRVFCGPDAAFSLWTDIILPETGIEMALDEVPVNPLGFLSAAASQLARDAPLQLRKFGDDFALTEASPLIDRFDSVFGRMPPEISIEDHYSVTDDAPQRARVTVLPSGYTLPNGPEFRRGGDGAIVFLLETGDYARAVQAFADVLPDQSPDPGIPFIEPGRQTTLAELGADGIEGRGRYIQKHVQFRLPSDWLLLASQDGELRLDWRFDTDLPDGGLLLVKVNGTTIRLLPLDEPQSAGRPLPTLRIPFAANLLQPGANRLTFEALVPGDPPDDACVPREVPIFEVSGGTRITIPPSPSMALPGIERTLQAAPRSAIAFSEASEVTLPMGLLPRLSSVLTTTLGEEADPRRDIAITIGIPADITSLGGDVVAGHSAALQQVMQSERQAPDEADDAWAQIDGDQWWRDILRRDRVTQFPARLNEWLRAIWTGNGAELTPWLEGRSADAMLVQPDMQRPGHLWLILKPGLEHRAVIASLAESRDAYLGPRGQVSLFSPDTGWQSWNAPNRPLLLQEPLTVSNARTVVGNYVTIIPGRYIGPLLILTIVSSVLAFGIALVTRRKRA